MADTPEVAEETEFLCKIATDSEPEHRLEDAHDANMAETSAVVTNTNQIETMDESVTNDNDQIARLGEVAPEQNVKWFKNIQEHVLLRPDMYVGSVDEADIYGIGFRNVPCKMAAEAEPSEHAAVEAGAPAPNPAKVKAIKPTWESTKYVARMSQAIRKLIDEALTNALDNGFRDGSQRNIRTAIDRQSGACLVVNDGAGIPATKYEDTDKYSISVVFGQFLSGSNFGEEDSYCGGRNGIGIACVNAFSKVFTVESACPASQTLFTQSWVDNMATEHPPSIKKFNGKVGYVRIYFQLDHQRLNTVLPEQGLSEEVMLALTSRVWDAAACSGLRKTNIYLATSLPPQTGFSKFKGLKELGKIIWQLLPVTNCKQYMQRLMPLGVECPTVATDTVSLNTGITAMQLAVTVVSNETAELLEECGSRVVAFVNGIRCCGGTHVKHVEARIVELVRQRVAVKLSKDNQIVVKPQAVIGRLMIVMACLCSKKAFTSQAKEVLSTPLKDLGFCWVPSNSFQTALLDKTSLVTDVIAVATEKQTAANQKSATNRSSTSRIEKYDPPAKGAGDKTLLVVEGVSAKAFATSGLQNRLRHGIYPLGGKLMNARSSSDLQISANKEIRDLCNILQLTPGCEYTEEQVAKLPYNTLTILTDQDSDGIHILGLIVSFMHHSFPSLLRVRPDYVRRFFTPLVKAIPTKGADPISFYSLKALKEWQDQTPADLRRQTEYRYFKGLGTSNSQEARECFVHEKRHTMTLRYTGEECDKALETYFGKGHAEERKLMIGDAYDITNQVDFAEPEITYTDVVQKDLVHFARYDTARSIPSLIDGCKIVIRKVMYYALCKVKSRSKVAQVGAAVAAFTHYVHGESSVTESVVGIAQEHVGTNNLAYLLPSGQFGSRHLPPSKHSAVRYLHTEVQPIAFKMFRKEDADLLDYAHEEGHKVEPEYFVPVVPTILINGGCGIGTGYSTAIPCHNPLDVFAACKLIATDQSAELPEICPHWDGFTGDVIRTETGYTTVGRYTVNDEHDMLTITELPVSKWIENYISWVKQMLMTADDDKKRKRHSGSRPLVLDIFNGSTEHHVHIELTTDPEVLRQLRAAGESTLLKTLQLYSHFSTNNMWGFDEKNKIVKIKDVREVVRMHSRVRLQLYATRLRHQIAIKREETEITGDTLRYVTMVVHRELLLFREVGGARLHEELEHDLVAHEFCPRALPPGGGPSFGYLHSLPIRSLTAEKIAELAEKLERLRQELAVLENTTPQQLWCQELDEVAREYTKYQQAKIERQGKTKVTQNIKKKRRKPRVKN